MLYGVRQPGIQAAVREACTCRLITLSGVHLLYKIYLKFTLVLHGSAGELATPKVSGRRDG